MPLVKGIQEGRGKGKLEVLLLSVDRSYRYGGTGGADKTVAMNDAKLKETNVHWPNVLLPQGFDDTLKLFNIDGYGLTLIGPDGTVCGVNIKPDEVDAI